MQSFIYLNTPYTTLARNLMNHALTFLHFFLKIYYLLLTSELRERCLAMATSLQWRLITFGWCVLTFICTSIWETHKK